MQAAGATIPIFGPAVTNTRTYITSYRWETTNDSELTVIKGDKIGPKRYITLNFRTPEATEAFCLKYDFRGAILQLGCITLSSYPDLQKVTNIFFSTCSFSQEADKAILLELANDCPKSPSGSTNHSGPFFASSILDSWPKNQS